MPRICLIAVLVILSLLKPVEVLAESRFLVLNYHDIVELAEGEKAESGTDISLKHLQQQFDWLAEQGYHVVSLQQLLDAKVGKTKLPEKSVLLTFDDGYQSFFTKLLPLLEKYRYSAVVALVGSWLEGKEIPEDLHKPFLTWEQVKALQSSGWIEIASHSYAQHKGVTANPQGNTQASLVTHFYDEKTGQYEADKHYLQRIQQDLDENSQILFKHLGIKPRVMVWPYGEYNRLTIAAARKAGMAVTMGLVDGDNALADTQALRRLIIVEDPDIEQFAGIVTKLRSDLELRVAHVDLDYLYDENPVQTEKNLGLLLDRIKAMHINTVFLQAYADPDGDGNADALYFPNRHMPVKQDLFNRVAWQLKRVSEVKVFAWMPILSYRNNLPEDWYVKEWREGKAQKSSHIYTRLSPFNDKARRYIGEIYEDLAKYCNFDGILFHDDGILSDFEDVSPKALTYAHKHWGLPAAFAPLHATSSMRLAWAERKAELINRFTDELTEKVRVYRPGIKTARNIYALPLLKPFSEEWYAQSYPGFLKHYDYTAVEAMPFMEQAEEPMAWLSELVKTVQAQPDGIAKTVFELQATDWEKQAKIPRPVFLQQLEFLKNAGVKHIGYYPDNVFENQPPLEDLQTFFSVPEIP
ncbi:MAG: poly-beta-1,6-N-acetyl-D-glucosamine N-deacetylase PgaB [Methylobacter sp.]|nr:MAG: poly-beta-1,6-N-acetyl-D-glucosamine N-deacetylase PgaB [Methylobacter sp.]